jgi:hypothetical protein
VFEVKDIESHLKQIIEREKSAKLICAELNNFTDLKPTLITVINYIKNITKCEAISIRLHDKGDYPYFTYNGFPESFIQHENSLCTKDKNGNPLKSPDGKGYLLDCMCGNIIQGRFDAAQPFFTDKGSFWSNNTSALLATTTEEDRQATTRNYCNSCGYESVALIPIKARNKTNGLIQINDKKIGLFNDELIEYIEMIGEHIGLAIQNSFNYTKLKNALDEIKILRGLIPICSCCKKVRDDKGFWEAIEVYIRDHSEAEFSHGLCPDCAEKMYPELNINFNKFR